MRLLVRWGMVSPEVHVRLVIGGMLLGMAGCRDYHDPLPFEDCQPYTLECALCTYEEDLAQEQGLRRAYRCVTGDGASYDAVLREGDLDTSTDDVHYYDPDSGFRVAAERRYPEPIDVCGLERDVEWYGEILEDCEIVCELEVGLPEADPQLEACDGPG